MNKKTKKKEHSLPMALTIKRNIWTEEDGSWSSAQIYIICWIRGIIYGIVLFPVGMR